MSSRLQALLYLDWNPGFSIVITSILRVSVDEFQLTQTFKTRVSKWDVKMDRIEQRAAASFLLLQMRVAETYHTLLPN
jgi:hypothetical protein